MDYFGRFYLDKEKDLIITLFLSGHQMSYLLTTPNHKTGNLITNLARLCQLKLSYDSHGFKIIKGKVPCYYDGNDQKVYILRFAGIKVANIYPDGRIERKAYIPAIAKTLMSQTKDYTLNAEKTLVKTYIREEVKFHTDLHTHRSGNLSPDILIALGIYHQLSYPYYYIKKLGLKISLAQRELLETEREKVKGSLRDSGLEGKYLSRRIDDHTMINFAYLIFGNLAASEENISKIRSSLAIMKDGQAVFTDLEKVYLYRYIFTKGIRSKEIYTLQPELIEKLPDPDIINALKQMKKDHEEPDYRHNTLYQDELLWVCRGYAKTGIYYAEISDTALVKPAEASGTLAEIHDIMPQATKETGVVLRFLASLRRIPLTIVKDHIEASSFRDNLRTLAAIADDPYVAGSDFVGEEMNDIRELRPVIEAIVKIARSRPSFVIRIHAGENDSLPDNVLHSIECVEEALTPGQFFPHMRIGHGLYTAKLNSKKGRELLAKLRDHQIVLEFQITSNVRLNNLSELKHHPLKQYLAAWVNCVQGTDGGALYGTDSLDEQLSLERMLELSFDELLKMRESEERILKTSLREFHEKLLLFDKKEVHDVKAFYKKEIENNKNDLTDLTLSPRHILAKECLASQIKPLPEGMIPIVIVGGSFNNATHTTRMKKEECHLLDDLINKADSDKVFFVIGSSLTGYERYLLEKARGHFQIFSFVPAMLTEKEARQIKKANLAIRVSLESSPLGVYKSFADEIFKRRPSMLIALDGNSAANNLIQDAKNSQYICWTIVDERSRNLRAKGSSLEGYVSFWRPGDNADMIIKMLKRTRLDI